MWRILEGSHTEICEFIHLCKNFGKTRVSFKIQRMWSAVGCFLPVISIKNNPQLLEFSIEFIFSSRTQRSYFRTCRFEKQTLMHLWRIWKIFSFNFQEVRWVFVYAKKRVLANIYFKSGKESNAIRIQATLNSGISVSVIYLLFYSNHFPQWKKTSSYNHFIQKLVVFFWLSNGRNTVLI